MADINGNVSTIRMQGQGQAASFWPLASRKTNPQNNTNPQTSAPPRLSGENGGRL